MVKGSQSVVDQTFLGSIGVVEKGRCHATIIGFINTYKLLRWRVKDIASGDVRQVLIPVSPLVRHETNRRALLSFAYHLCCMKLVWYSACITGGLGCSNPEENSIIEGGNGRQPEPLTGSTPAAIVTKSNCRKCMLRKRSGRMWALVRRKDVFVRCSPWECWSSYTFIKNT